MTPMRLVVSLLALGSAAAPLSAQDSTTRHVTVIEPAQKIDDNIVRAQFIRPGDVSPEEYARLLAEADRIRAYQAANGANSYPLPASTTTTYQERKPQTYTQYQLQQRQVHAPTYTMTPQATYAAPQPSYATPNPAPRVTYQAPAQQVTYATQPNAGTQSTASYQTPIAAHQVVKGDTLYNISKRYGVTLSALRQANGINGSHIRIGQNLTIPSVTKTVAVGYRAPTVTQQVPVRRTTQTLAPQTTYGTTYVRNVEAVPANNVYAVLPNDTLYSIARFTCSDALEIARLNGIVDAGNLQAGQKLTMPAGHCLR